MFPLSHIFQSELVPVNRPKNCLLNFWVGVALCKGSFFALAAYVQHNDPDPLLWMPAYGIPSALSFYVAWHLYKRKGGAINSYLVNGNSLWVEHLIQCQLVYSFLLGGYTLFLSGEEALEKEYDTMMVEEGKELMGLCIIIVWLTLIYRLNFLRITPRVGVAIGTFIAVAPILSWIFVESFHHCQ